MAKVNLDALISREDFEISESINTGKKKDTLSIEDLKNDSFFLSSLRKPDFQRETNEWDADRISQFIESFVHGDLIPAIILWRSTISGYIFVIDGAHRLSTLIGWINDDYGDGKISKQFYEGIISEEQIDISENARRIIRKKIGPYNDFRLALTNPDKVNPTIVQLSKNLGALAIQLQWVEGDINTAEKSFLKINQQAAPIDPVELKLLESRKKPNCIAARAIIKSGKGHKYWSKFSDDKQLEIQNIAKEINETLFSPRMRNPIKTLDLPIAGKLYSSQTLPLILDFINITNNISADFKDTLADDPNGDQTIQCLKKTRRIAQLINSVHPGSLGLHPIIYFYSHDGKYKVASFYSVVYFVMELDKKNKLNIFTKNRKIFEEIIYDYDYVIQQIFRKYRGALASMQAISNYYFKVLECLEKRQTKEEVLSSVIKDEQYNYITLIQEREIVTSNTFSSERKSAVFIKDVISKAPRCKICGGLIHTNSMTIDHIERKQDGGLGSVDNGQLAHPYCNTTFKN